MTPKQIKSDLIDIVMNIRASEPTAPDVDERLSALRAAIEKMPDFIPTLADLEAMGDEPGRQELQELLDEVVGALARSRR